MSNRARLEELRAKHGVAPQQAVAPVQAQVETAAPVVAPVVTPNRQRLEELRAKQKTLQQPATPPAAIPEGGTFESIVEPALAVGSGLVGSVAGGLAAIPQTIAGDPRGAEETLRSIQEFLSVQPKTQAGQRGLETVAEGFERVADVPQAIVGGLGGIAELAAGEGIEQATKTVEDVQEKGIGKTAGDRAFEVTGSPLLSAAAETAPDIVTSLIPIVGMAKARSALNAKLADKIKISTAQPELASQIRLISKDIVSGKISKADAPDALLRLEKDVRLKSGGSPADKIIQVSKDIKGNRPEQVAGLSKIADDVEVAAPQKSLALYTAEGASKVKGDAVAKEAVRQGFDQGVIAAVKGATRLDRRKMADMVKIMQKGKENALFAAKNRPSDIAGSSLLERVNHVKKVNRNAGKRLDEVAKSLKGQQVDSSVPIKNFMDNLEDMGVTIDKQLQPVFKGSDIEGALAPEKAIRNMVKRLTSGKPGSMPDAYELHRMKRFIDETVTYGKAGEGLAGKTERILKQLRADLDSTLDSKFHRYNKVNTQYSDTVGALDELQGVAGKKMDLFGPNADKATGTLLRRLMSNAQSRVNLVDAVDVLESTAKKYGGRFNDDISTQMLFADELDSVFGAVAKTSLQGDVVKGVKTGVEHAAGGRGAIGAALDVVSVGSKKVRGINEEQAFKTIRSLLGKNK